MQIKNPASNEVFTKPTVKQVMFQITFPSYFSIENKIGEFQLKVMDRLPVSALLLQNQFLLYNSTSVISTKLDSKESPVKKIWQFKNEEEKITLNITDSSLDITSEKHKTYNNEAGGTNKFRDFIEFIVTSFFEFIPIPIINRMGLRYIDDCPLPEELTSESFSTYYNSCFNLSNIDINSSVKNLLYESLIESNGVTIQFSETLRQENGRFIYGLDFDGVINNLKAVDYLDNLDIIHDETSNSFFAKIKEPVKNKMRE